MAEDEGYFFKPYVFPKEKTAGGIENIFFYVDMKTRTKTEFSEIGTGKWLTGIISKGYEDILAYAVMSFGAKDIMSDVPPEKRLYCSVTLRAEAPWKKRIESTERLSAEVAASLEDFFSKY